MKLKIINFATHRNGICGAPFDVALFEDHGPEGSRKVAILFEKACHCAVLDVDKLAAGDIAFASNSWRGDHYEPHLRAAKADRPPVELPETDIHDLLAKHQQIAAIWGIEDVQSIRPDLSEQQAWQVLQMVDRRKDAELGITWLTLEIAAEDLFGDAPETDDAEEE